MRERRQGLDFFLQHKALNLVLRAPIPVRDSGNTPAVAPWVDPLVAADWDNTQAEVVQEAALVAEDWRNKPVAAALPELVRPQCHTLATQEAVLANKPADLSLECLPEY